MATSGEYGRHDFGQGGLNDGLDVGELVDEIGLDGDEIAWRKEFVGFDDEDERRLSRYEDAFAENAEQIADDFYENLTGHQQTVDVIGRSEKGLEQLKRTQSAYLVTLAEGEYGAEYFADRARIGKIHDSRTCSPSSGSSTSTCRSSRTRTSTRTARSSRRPSSGTRS